MDWEGGEQPQTKVEYLEACDKKGRFNIETKTVPTLINTFLLILPQQ